MGMLFFQAKGQVLVGKDSVVDTPKDSLVDQVQRIDYALLKGNSELMQIDLEEVFLVGPYKYKNRLDRRRYLILKYKTKRVWPYAVLAAKRLSELNKRLSSIESGYKKRRYIKIVQRYIQDEFTDQLKKLTKTEGQILVKLMYRQTGETTFNIVKELKSGWRAFWYNTTASLFNISLKEKYKPEEVREDYLIEHILRRSFQKGELEKHRPKISIDFEASMKKWQ